MNKYRLNVIIASPEAPEREAEHELLFSFVYEPEQYGNGHYAMARGAGFWQQLIDLRYDT